VGIACRDDKNSAYLTASLVGYALGLKAEQILRDGRGPHILVQARQAAMYLAHISCGMSLARVAAAFGRDRSTVAYACQRIEDKRDEDAFDAWMEALEKGLVAVAPLSNRAA